MDMNKIHSILNSSFRPALAEGTYQTKMVSYKEVLNEREPKKSYVRFEFAVLKGPSKGRVIVENRFEQGLPVLISHVRQQLERQEEEIIPTDFFDELIEKETPIEIWVTRVITSDGRQRTNINFLEPLVPTKAVADEEDDVVNTLLDVE